MSNFTVFADPRTLCKLRFAYTRSMRANNRQNRCKPAWVRSKTVVDGASVAGCAGAVLETRQSIANSRHPRHFALFTLCDCHGRRTTSANAAPFGVNEE